MKTNRKHGFTIVELVVVIAIIAVLAAVLIPTFASIIKKANDSAYLQERTNHQIEDLAEKVENQNYLTWEDFEAVLARELAKVGSPDTEAIKNAVKVALAERAGSDNGLSEAQVQKIINEAMSGQLTTAQVQAIVEQSIKNAGISVGTSGGVTAAQVKSIVSAAIANIPTQTGVTPEMVKNAVASALANANVTVNQDDIAKALKAFGVSTLTEEQIVEIATQIATQVSEKTGNEKIVATLNIRAAGNEKATLYDTFGAMSISDPTTAVKSISAGETILWDSVDKKFVLDKDNTLTGARYWTVSDVISDKWSTYYTGTASTISTTKGFDAGTTTSVTSVTYTNSEPAQNVVIRTNSANTNLTINAEHDTVNHYGFVGKVDAQKIDMNCYNEYGTAAYVKVTEGKVVAKDGGRIAVVFANNTDQTKVAVAKETNGTIERGLTTVEIVDSTNFATYEVHLEYTVDGTTPYTEESIEAIAQTAIADLIDEEVADTVVRAVTNESTDYYSFKEFAQKVNAGDFDEEKNITFTLMANVDLKNEEWTPIGTAEHPFKWVFDGNGYTIKNFKISSSNARGEDALFGFVVGDTNMNAIDLAARWNSSTYSFDTSNVEALYTAVVKNFTVSGATVSSAHAENKTNNASGTNRKSTAAAIGVLRCAYAENIVVENSTINGYKTVGGVIGSLDGGSIDNCKTTSSVTINGYSNIGGIVGGLENANDDWKSNKNSIISNCENNATINKITEDKAYGYVGGIIGTAQNDKSAVVACVVNGVIHSVNSGLDPAGGTSGAVGGVIGQTGAGGYFINLTNNAVMTIEGSHGYVGGITEYAGESTLYNCVNNADITAKAIQVAGIMAGAQTGNTTYISCVNNGSLVNTNAQSAVFDISSVNGVARIENQTFKTVADLQAELNAQNLNNCTNIKLINVTVTDTTGALSIPAKIEAITSDKKVCSTITLESGRERGLSVQMPGIDYTYDASNVIWFNVEGGNITVPAGITVPSLSVTGASSVTINGTVTNGVSATNVSTITNNGTIGYISLRGANGANVLFNNIGNVGGFDGSSNHSVYTISNINLAINNHGSIKAGEGNYALLFYGNSTVVFNAYAGSTITKASDRGAIAINNGPSVHAKFVTFNVASGAEGVENNKYYGSSSFNSSTYDCRLVINFDANLEQ